MYKEGSIFVFFYLTFTILDWDYMQHRFPMKRYCSNSSVREKRTQSVWNMTPNCVAVFHAKRIFVMKGSGYEVLEVPFKELCVLALQDESILFFDTNSFKNDVK